MQDFEAVFELTKTDLGWISGAAFWGFGLSIFVGGPLCDLLGMRTLMRLAAVGHASGTLFTIFAPNSSVVFAATLLIGIANGLVEAAINPLVATIYPKEKTSKLVVLHAWFPGGIVIGGVLTFTLTQVGLGWQAKMLFLLIPTAIYLVMFLGQDFPPTERYAAGVSFGAMIKEAFRPLFILLWLCVWLTASTEMGPGQWIPNIYNEVMGSSARVGILVLVWTNGLMYVVRQFGGPRIQRVSPIGLIAGTSILAAVGLFLYSSTTNAPMAFGAAVIYALGIAFWWPTMLGITSERFPKGGAFLLAIIAGTGSISTAISGPAMGWINDTYGPERVLTIWALLPVAIGIVFGSVYLADRARGGYQAEKLEAMGK
jgi:MFS family permease